MKKFLLSILTIAIAVAVLVPVAAFAATSQETEIADYVKKQDKVVDAKCLTYDNNCIVSIKTEKFLNKTEYDNFKKNLEDQLADKYDFDHIIVTRNPKAMHAIEQISKLSETEREQAVKDFMEKIISKHPHKLPLEPKR